MLSATFRTSPVTRYSALTLERARCAVRCSPFTIVLFRAMTTHSVALPAIAGKIGAQNGFTAKPVPEAMVERSLLWLIQVGLLRREVDGQGLTDSFRLTPLGHDLTVDWQKRGNIPRATVGDRIRNFWHRWIRLPAWLIGI
jgi:hypothetical protein